jgi:hypothetical protein
MAGTGPRLSAKSGHLIIEDDDAAETPTTSDPTVEKSIEA